MCIDNAKQSRYFLSFIPFPHMKKVMMLSTCLFSAIVLVWCGTQTPQDTTDQNPTPNLEQNTANNQEQNDAAPEGDANLDELATCITDAWLTMYGTEWCSHCKDQKALFGASFANINFVDCDASKPACVAAGVQWFPTWQDGEGNNYPGKQPVATLAEIAGCTM